MSKLKNADRFGRTDLNYTGVLEAPFRVHGVRHDGRQFIRLPEDVAKAANEGVATLYANTAGGRVRFVTDSEYVAIHAEMASIGKMGHFAASGSAGFDLYADNAYAGTFVPPYDQKDGYDGIVYFESAKPREITVNLPLYSNVTALYIGLRKDAYLGEPSPYLHKTPVVYYGSSITQGGCATRPGLSYQSILSRRLDTEYLNLGFSGSCKAEDAMIRYLCGLEMSVFVYDYDHNAPSPEYLAATHEKLYKAMRFAKPDLPIVLMSRPKFTLNEDDRQRLRIIERTYDSARAAGDDNIYLLDGPTLMALAGDEGTVDGCHPNDLGFFSMANALEPVLRKLVTG